MTAVLQMHLEHPGDQPVSTVVRFATPLEYQEEQFSRRITLDEFWKPIPAGFVDYPGVIVLENRAGANLQTIPTPEERAELAKRIVVIGKPEDAAGLKVIVRPTRFVVLEFASLDGLSMRCLEGSAEVRLVVYSR